MDWMAVFAALGGAAGFAGSAKFVAGKVVEQVISSRGGRKTDKSKASSVANAEHRALVARTQLDVVGAVLDAIYPLKLSLDHARLGERELSREDVSEALSAMGAAIDGLVANLGSKRAYIPEQFVERVHALKNHLYSVRATLSDEMHRTRGDHQLRIARAQRAEGLLADMAVVTRELFSDLVEEAQRRVSGDLAF